MDDLYTFPADACEALAMLYVQRQDLTGQTPESLYGMYMDALERISEAHARRIEPETVGEWL